MIAGGATSSGKLCNYVTKPSAFSLFNFFFLNIQHLIEMWLKIKEKIIFFLGELEK